MEDLLLIEDAVIFTGSQNANLILCRTIVATRNQDATFAPRLSGERTTSVWILRGLGNPQATAFIPLDGDRLINQGLGRNNAGLEAGLHLESGDGLFGTTGSTDRVTHVHEILRGAEFVDIGTTGSPGDAPLNEGAVAGMRERLRFTLQKNRGTKAVVLEHPDLWLDVVDGGLVGDFRDFLTIGADLRGER